MANIKNFGIVGVGSNVQFGKGGAQIIQTAGTFAAQNATGNAFVRFQIADGAATNDAVTYQQHSNAVASLNSNAAALGSLVSNARTGAGLNSDGSYTAPAETNYLANATSLNNADFLLDAAIAAEVARAEAAEAAIANASTSAIANAVLVETNRAEQAESDLSNAIAAETGRAEGAESALTDAVTAVNANVTALSGQVSSDEANALALANTVASNFTTLNSAITAETIRAEGAESDLSNAIANSTSALAAEVTRAEGAEAVLTNAVVAVNANVTTEVGRAEAAESDLSNSIAAANAAIAAEVTRAEGAESDLSNSIAAANAAIAAEVTRAEGAESDLSNSIAAANAAIAAEVTRAEGVETGLDTRLTTVEGSYVNKDGSVAMTGNLNLGNNVINNVGTGVSSTDAVNVGQLTGAIAALGNAFDYIGTVTPGPDTGNATVLNAVAHAGAYYKATQDGFLIGAEANSVAFHVYKNDGVVRNIQTDGAVGTWDTIAHTESSVDGTAGQIVVTGTVDTGFTISIDSTYTTTIDQAISDEANARIAGDSLNANAIAAETSRAEGAESDLSNSITVLNGEMTAVNANVTALAGQVSSDEANALALANTVASNYSTLNSAINAETIRAEAAEAALANATSNAVAVETARAEQAESDLSNSITLTNSNVTTVAGNLAAEVTRAEGAESDLSNAIALVNANVTTEVGRAEAAEAVLTNAVVAVNANVTTEVGRAEAAEADLSNAIALVNANVTTEVGRAEAAESALSNTITAIEAAAGLVGDAYVANSGANYIASAVSLFDADNMLDNAVAAIALELSTLSQDTIKTTDSLNSVHVANDAITTKLNVGGVATTVLSVTGGSATNSALTMDFTTANAVALTASGTDANVDLRLAAQGSGHVIIGETGVGVIQSDTGYDMTVASGSGAALNLLGDTAVNIGEADGTTIAQFTGTAGATGYATVLNGNTAVTLGAAGAGTNIDLVFAPKGSGVVNVSGAKVINVANATNATDAVNLQQLTAAVISADLGVVKTLTAILPATSGAVALGTITGTVLSVKVLISAGYDAGSTITVGGATANDLAASTDIDESTAGIYLVETASVETAQAITATVTNATGLNGAAYVVVEYLQG
jgi:hypothetical protein